ncbi:MAG: hypothetical protein IPH72_05905 [Sandaracinaceae bacterium]|nr:hypothetical protein [Sandaracinaceae bacterium]
MTSVSSEVPLTWRAVTCGTSLRCVAPSTNGMRPQETRREEQGSCMPRQPVLPPDIAGVQDSVPGARTTCSPVATSSPAGEDVCNSAHSSCGPIWYSEPEGEDAKTLLSGE